MGGGRSAQCECADRIRVAAGGGEKKGPGEGQIAHAATRARCRTPVESLADAAPAQPIKRKGSRASQHQPRRSPEQLDKNRRSNADENIALQPMARSPLEPSQDTRGANSAMLGLYRGNLEPQSQYLRPQPQLGAQRRARPRV